MSFISLKQARSPLLKCMESHLETGSRALEEEPSPSAQEAPVLKLL